VSDPATLRSQIAHLSGRQHGHVTRAQLLGLGMAPSTISAWMRGGKLVRVHLGVYAVGYRRVEPRALAVAAVLACGDGAALSHDSAAALWRLPRRWPRDPEVTAPRCIRRPAIVAHRSRTLRPRDIVTHYGIRVTTVLRTLADLRPRLTDEQFARAVNGARLDHSLSTDDATRLLGDAHAPITRSKLERDFLAFCAHHGLPTPVINTRLHGHEVDAHFPDHRLIVELDDYATHGDPATFAADRVRDADHLEHDHRTLRLTRERFTAAEAARLTRLLGGRRG
jgi:hypothetical protein